MIILGALCVGCILGSAGDLCIVGDVVCCTCYKGPVVFVWFVTCVCNLLPVQWSYGR